MSSGLNIVFIVINLIDFNCEMDVIILTLMQRCVFKQTTKHTVPGIVFSKFMLSVVDIAGW